MTATEKNLSFNLLLCFIPDSCCEAVRNGRTDESHLVLVTVKTAKLVVFVVDLHNSDCANSGYIVWE